MSAVSKLGRRPAAAVGIGVRPVIRPFGPTAWKATGRLRPPEPTKQSTEGSPLRAGGAAAPGADNPEHVGLALAARCEPVDVQVARGLIRDPDDREPAARMGA